jgi:BrnA antitoxin of type II toxin-antitoxin system
VLFFGNSGGIRVKMSKDYDFANARPGSVLPSRGKTRITIMLDDDLLDHFRESATAQGIGYQTLINGALRQILPVADAATADQRPVTLAALRQVLREELRAP